MTQSVKETREAQRAREEEAKPKSELKDDAKKALVMAILAIILLMALAFAFPAVAAALPSIGGVSGIGGTLLSCGVLGAGAGAAGFAAYKGGQMIVGGVGSAIHTAREWKRDSQEMGAAVKHDKDMRRKDPAYLEGKEHKATAGADRVTKLAKAEADATTLRHRAITDAKTYDAEQQVKQEEFKTVALGERNKQKVADADTKVQVKSKMS